jgi:hypothetical protein
MLYFSIGSLGAQTVQARRYDNHIDLFTTGMHENISSTPKLGVLLIRNVNR